MNPRLRESPPKAVLFDLDDTLCDYKAARRERLQIAFSLARQWSGHDPDDEALAAMVARSIEMHPHGADHFGALFAAFGIRDQTAADLAADWYRQNRFHALQLYSGAADILRAAKHCQSGGGSRAVRPIGIVTNGPVEVQRAKIDLLGLGTLVDFVIVSEEFGVAKPDPAIFQEALRRAGVAPHEAIFIGDSPEFDIAGAHAAAIPSVWVNPTGNRWPGPGHAPHFQIQTLAELPALIGCSR